MKKSKLFKALIGIGGLVVVFLVVFALVKCTRGPEEFSVAFDTDGGSVISTMVVEKGDVVSPPGDPVKEGFTFTYWESDGNEFDFSKPITGDMTLKAVWEPITFIVTFDVNGGSGVNDQIVPFGEKVSKPGDPTRDGYDFTGWTLDNKEFDFSQAIDKDLTLVAVWEKVEEVIPEPTPQPTAAPSPTPEPTAAPTPTTKPTAAPKPTTKPTEATKPKPEPTTAPPVSDPVYTIDTYQPDEFLGTPTVVVRVYKDGKPISAIAVYSDGVEVADIDNDKGLLITNKFEIDSINKAKLSDGTVVTIKR